MESDVRHAIRWVMRDNPDIFWFVHQYHYDKDDGIVSLRYRCSSERCAIIKKSIDDVVVNDFKIAHVCTLSQLEQSQYSSLTSSTPLASRLTFIEGNHKTNLKVEAIWKL